MVAHINTILLSGNQLQDSKLFLHCFSKIFNLTCNMDRARSHKKTQLTYCIITSCRLGSASSIPEQYNFFFSFKIFGLYSHRYQAQYIFPNLPQYLRIKTWGRKCDLLDFRVLTTLPSWSASLRAINDCLGRHYPQAPCKHLAFTIFLRIKPTTTLERWERKAQGHTPTLGFTPASHTWTGPPYYRKR